MIVRVRAVDAPLRVVSGVWLNMLHSLHDEVPGPRLLRSTSRVVTGFLPNAAPSLQGLVHSLHVELRADETCGHTRSRSCAYYR